jgi:hypothetical protein
MKNKNLIILFFIFLILIFPLEKVYAIAWAPIIRLGLVVGSIIGIKFGVPDILNDFGEQVLRGIAVLVYHLTKLVHSLLWWYNTEVLSKLIDNVSRLNPFPDKGPSPVAVLWNILKNFAYILLVFSALAAAYEWLLGDDASAKRLIFNIIVVALIISFTFVLVKEAFLIVNSLEQELSGISEKDKVPNSKIIGTIMVASLWQGDPIKEVLQLAPSIEDADKIQKYLADIAGYLFIISLDMLIFIILVIALILFIARYVIFIFLAGTSSIAVASLTFPEFRSIPGLRETVSQFRIFETWFGYFVRWLLIIPIFVILVLLGNVLKENVLGHSGPAENLTEFLILFVIIMAWYIISIRIAVKLSGAIGVFAKSFATGLLAIPGVWAAKKVMKLAKEAIGGALRRISESIQNKVGVGGIFGWRSRIFHLAESMKGVGGKMLEDRAKQLEKELEYLAGQLTQAAQTGNQQQIQKASSQFADFIRKHQNLFTKDISKGIDEKLSIKTIQRIMETDPQSLQKIASQIKDQKIKDSYIDKLEKAADKKTLRIIMSKHPNFFEKKTFQGLDQDIQRVFADSIRTQLSESDALNLVLQTRQQIKNFHTAIIDALNRQTKGFVKAYISKNVNQIASALADFKSDTWDQFNTIEFFRALSDQKLARHIAGIYATAIQNSENPMSIIRAIIRNEPHRDPNAGPTRQLLYNQRGKLMPSLIQNYSNDPRMQSLISKIFS